MAGPVNGCCVSFYIAPNEKKQFLQTAKSLTLSFSILDKEDKEYEDEMFDAYPVGGMVLYFQDGASVKKRLQEKALQKFRDRDIKEGRQPGELREGDFLCLTTNPYESPPPYVYVSEHPTPNYQTMYCMVKLNPEYCQLHFGKNSYQKQNNNPQAASLNNVVRPLPPNEVK